MPEVLELHSVRRKACHGFATLQAVFGFKFKAVDDDEKYCGINTVERSPS